MKADIHPEYVTATVSCACGMTFETRSAAGSLKVDICSACHPFFTGTQKIVDTEGRVERFKKKYAGPAVRPAAKTKPKTRTNIKPSIKPSMKPKARIKAKPKPKTNVKTKA